MEQHLSDKQIASIRKKIKDLYKKNADIWRRWSTDAAGMKSNNAPGYRSNSYYNLEYRRNEEAIKKWNDVLSRNRKYQEARAAEQIRNKYNQAMQNIRNKYDFVPTITDIDNDFRYRRALINIGNNTATRAQRSTKQIKQTKYTAKPITGSSYKVKYGDTLLKIARRAGMTVKELALLNNIEDVNKIVAGQTLKLENIATKNAAKRAAEQVRNYYESNFADEPVDLSSLNESMPVSDETKEQYLTDAYNQGALNRYFDAMDYYSTPQQTMVYPQEDYSPIANMMTPQNVASALYNNYYTGM